MKFSSALVSIFFFFLLISDTKFSQAQTKLQSNDYQSLVSLFKEWRTFEKPPLLNGAPDYTAKTFERRWPEFKKLQAIHSPSLLSSAVLSSSISNRI